MWRTVSRLGPISMSGFFSLGPSKSHDKVETEIPVSIRDTEPITGMDRVKDMFSVDEFGAISDSLNSVLQTMALSSLVGALYGGIMKSRVAYANFMDSNQATMFKSNIDAQTKLQEEISRSFSKGAMQLAWRLALFTGSFTLIIKTIEAYRGKISIWEYIFAGMCTGAVYKSNMGLRGSIVGGTLGAVLGTFAGGLTIILLDFSGVSMEDVHFWQHQFRHQRMESNRKIMASMDEHSSHPLLQKHDKNVQTNTEVKTDEEK